MNFHNSPDQLRRRKDMSDEIIDQVRTAIWEELADAAAGFSRKQLEDIETDIMAQTQRVVDALGFDEMGSQGALLSHIANARWDAGRLIRERRAPSGLRP
jgi:hypothetical protein